MIVVVVVADIGRMLSVLLDEVVYAKVPSAVIVVVLSHIILKSICHGPLLKATEGFNTDEDAAVVLPNSVSDAFRAEFVPI